MAVVVDAPCITSTDCAMNGECTKGNGDPQKPGHCRCGWKGDTCEVLDLLPVDVERKDYNCRTVILVHGVDRSFTEMGLTICLLRKLSTAVVSTPGRPIVRSFGIIVLRVGNVGIPRPREGADEMDPRVGWDTEASKEL